LIEIKWRSVRTDRPEPCARGAFPLSAGHLADCEVPPRPRECLIEFKVRYVSRSYNSLALLVFKRGADG